MFTASNIIDDIIIADARAMLALKYAYRYSGASWFHGFASSWLRVRAAHERALDRMVGQP